MERKLPIKTSRVELTGEYEGWWYDFRTNPPVGPLIDAMAVFQNADPNAIQTVMPALFDMISLVISNWNFVDEQGKDIPADREGLQKLPLDLLVLIASKIQESVTAAPLAQSAS